MAIPHIFTLTGNLLAERTQEFERWHPGKTQRAIRESFQVGGKGINVSKMLTRLGVANTALCFTGGRSGEDCAAWLREKQFTFHAFATQRPTRVGTVVRDVSHEHKETTFLGPDAAPDDAAIAACARFLDDQPPGHVLALCGSFPGWSGPDFAPLRAALLRWKDRGILVVDSYGPPLIDLTEWPLDLLKINAEELRSVASSATDLPRPAKRVIVTDGPHSVRWRDVDGTIAAVNPPTVHEVSATGSGDVFLACVIDALFRRKTPLSNAVAFAIPYATANAAHPGIGEFPLPSPST